MTRACVLHRGGTAVVTTGTTEPRFYHSTGTFLRGMGSEGPAVGEFPQPVGHAGTYG